MIDPLTQNIVQKTTNYFNVMQGTREEKERDIVSTCHVNHTNDVRLEEVEQQGNVCKYEYSGKNILSFLVSKYF